MHDRARLLRAVAGLQLDAWAEDDPFGQARYLVVAPHVEEWGSHRYTAVFFVSYDHLRTANRSTAWGIAGLAVFGLLLGVGCAQVLAAQSLEPLKKLTRGARRLAAGHLDERIALATRDEFQVLSETLDHMAEQLATTIEDLERSNQRLGRLNDELQQLDRLKSDLLANVSHELRTPLTAIGGYVEAMEEGILGELDATQLQSLRVVRRNVGRLRAMIDQLLSYSRMEQSRLRVELQPFELAPVVRQAVGSMRAIHGDRLDLRLRCPEELPQVYGDPGAIAQVLENLLTNAVKFSPESGAIEVEIRELGTGVEVAVRDHGVGIPAAEQKKIFDRFYQVDASSRRKFGGMGLGLAIVKELLEQHHSEIRVESRAGGGSVFRFILPSALERTGKIKTTGGRRIALIDDDPGFVQRVAHHLSHRGFQVETAATAAQGLAMIERVGPQAVLIDRLLPDDDGFELIARLKEREATRQLPVIVISVRQERTLALRLGAAAYLSKPVEPEVVEKTLLDVLATAPEAPPTGVV
ncbi:MAG: response regulator [Thermoanaerobaculia bacterium]|nr:response regulator [Thermoanaerobaculia bacterium]